MAAFTFVDLLIEATSYAVDYYVASKEAAATKKVANRTAELEQRRIGLLETERVMNEQRETARVKREARGRAAIANAQFGFYGLNKSSAATVGAQGAKTGTKRETDYIKSSSELAGQANTISSQQTELNRDTKIRSAQAKKKSVAVSGIASTAIKSFKVT